MGSKGMVLMRFLLQWLWKKGKENQAGFSLVEVLVGISILAIGMLAVARMQITAIQGIDQSEEATVALNLAQEQLEQIINGDYNSADLADNNNANNNNLAGARITDAGTASANEWDGLPTGGPTTVSTTTSGDYQIFWNVADNPSGTTQYKEVVVIIQWTRKGRTRTRTLSMVKSLAS
jgi:type IV pilus assembly protein PilV